MVPKNSRLLAVPLIALALLVCCVPVLAYDFSPEGDGRGGGCNVFAVGKDASVDGSTMVTVQQDTASYPFELIYVPAADHPPGTIKKLPDYPQYCRYFDEAGTPIDADHVYTGVEIPEVPHTYAYFKSLFGVMNEHQVSMGMSTIYPRNDLRNKTGKLKMTILSFVALERAKTAREAVKIIGELAEKYGFSSEYSAGKNLTIADPNEVWFLHMFQSGKDWDPESGEPGAIWVAQRLPDDHVACFSNTIAIHEIDLDNPDYFMASANLIPVAEKNGWWPAGKRPFNVCEAYFPSPVPGWCAGRQWRGWNLINPDLKVLTPEQAAVTKKADGTPYRYPFSAKPAKKVSVEDLSNWVKDTHDGTAYDLAVGPLAGPFGGWQRTQGDTFKTSDGKEFEDFEGIANDTSQFTEVCQMRGWLPNEIGGIVWWAPGPPKTCLRVPFYIGMTELSEQYGHDLNQHFPPSAFQWGKGAGWAAVFTNTFSTTLYNHIIKDVLEFQNKIEGQARSLIPGIDQAALALYKDSPAKAREFLTNWCNSFAEDAVKKHWDFNAYLVWKYHNRYIWEPTQSQSPTMNNQQYWIDEQYKWIQSQPGRQ